MKPSERIKEIINEIENNPVVREVLTDEIDVFFTAILKYLDEQEEKEVKKNNEYNERVAEFLKRF